MEFFDRMLKSTHPLLNVTLCCWFGCVYNTHHIVCVDCMCTILFCTQRTHAAMREAARQAVCQVSESAQSPSLPVTLQIHSSFLLSTRHSVVVFKGDETLSHTVGRGARVPSPAPLVHMTRVMCSNAGSCVHRCAIEVINVVFHDIQLIELCLDP